VSNHVDATFFAQVEPEWGAYDRTLDQRMPRAAKVVALTQKRPDRPRPNTVIVKLTVRVPKAAFLPLRPEAVVVIPEDMVVANEPVEVTAEDPRPL
jgi:hypothetical protein